VEAARLSDGLYHENASVKFLFWVFWPFVRAGTVEIQDQLFLAKLTASATLSLMATGMIEQ